MSDHSLYMYTIFDDPRDYPRRFVIRRFTIRPGEAVPDAFPWAICGSLDEARGCLPLGVDVRAPREPEDEPSIVETWF